MHFLLGFFICVAFSFIVTYGIPFLLHHLQLLSLHIVNLWSFIYYILMCVCWCRSPSVVIAAINHRFAELLFLLSLSNLRKNINKSDNHHQLLTNIHMILNINSVLASNKNTPKTCVASKTSTLNHYLYIYGKNRKLFLHRMDNKKIWKSNRNKVKLKSSYF